MTDFNWLSSQYAQPAPATAGSAYPWLTGQGFQPTDYQGLSLGNVNTPQGGGGLMGWLGKDGNLGTLFGGLQQLGSLYLGLEQLGVAKDNLKFQKGAYNTNLANSTQTYNTSLEDRITGRTADYAGKDADVAAYLASHKLPQNTI